MGGDNPIVIQSMANTDTNKIEQSVEQCIRIIDAGGDMVRFTTQGIHEVKSLRLIRQTLRAKNIQTPLVADVHFNANVADLAAQTVEKVRINPGNYVASIKKRGDRSDYTEEEYAEELGKIRKRFSLLLKICKANNTAIRIGVNHGSLSNRIMNKYGDTPQGMVASCMEFLRICREQDFDQVLISMKTSNTVMMVHTVRLLAQEMDKENFRFPLHLGVTEAGDGEDGRIKSAVGIGTLLSEGIGDTIRVSLSEAPENEIPVAKKIVGYAADAFMNKSSEQKIGYDKNFSPFESKKRATHAVNNIGGENVPLVIAAGNLKSETNADYLFDGKNIFSKDGTKYPFFSAHEIVQIKQSDDQIVFVKTNHRQLSKDFLAVLKEKQNIVLLLELLPKQSIIDTYSFFFTLSDNNCTAPVVLYKSYQENSLENLQISASVDFGRFFIDGLAEGLYIENKGNILTDSISSIAFGILQASRVRISKTEFISCPGCGRTMFDLEKVIARVKAKTSHLKGLKIGIMGCIVNGPGEMADADYGYVGAGRGTVSLYKKKSCVESNIPEDEAVDKLIELIKNNDDWIEPTA